MTVQWMEMAVQQQQQPKTSFNILFLQKKNKNKNIRSIKKREIYIFKAN